MEEGKSKGGGSMSAMYKWGIVAGVGIGIVAYFVFVMILSLVGA